MENQHLIDLAYKLVKERYNDKKFTYKSMWDLLNQKLNINKEKIAETTGDLYTDLLQDSRFIFSGNKFWQLREFLKRDEFVALKNSLYRFGDDGQEDDIVIKASTTDKEDDIAIVSTDDDDGDEEVLKQKESLNSEDDLEESYNDNRGSD